jgi:hypothetical protein
LCFFKSGSVYEKTFSLEKAMDYIYNFTLRALSKENLGRFEKNKG